MRCTDPYVRNGEAFSCGRCLPCLSKKRWEWAQRCILEASQHDYTSIVTLTYDDGALPVDGKVSPRHFNLWLKRMRKRSLERYGWRYLRFYGVGEYGEKTERPHYHAILFGQPGCSSNRGSRVWCEDCPCDTCFDVSTTWGLGCTSVDVATKEGMSYVAGYVTRKFSAGLGFTRMSRNPGIGCSAMWDVASAGIKYDRVLRVPGRYLTAKLAEFSCRAEPVFTPSEAMQAVREYAFVVGKSQKAVYRELNEPYASQLAQKARLKGKAL